MNRNIILGFAGGLVFAISLIIGLVVADNATDQGGGEPRLPGALGDPIELITGIPISDPDAPIDFDQPIEPTQAAYVPIDTGSGSAGGSGGSSSPGGGGVPADGDEDESPADGDTGADGAELIVAPLAPVDADFRFGDFFIGDLYFEFLDYPPFRFLDLCADDGALPGCPPGVGGTVFAPVSDPPAGGFRLGSHIRTSGDARATGATCDPTEPDESLVYVWANQPAEFNITYYPRGFNRESAIRGGLLRTVTVSNADPTHPEFLRYAEDWAEHRLATSAWPQECFILTPILQRLGDDTLTRTYDRYTVEVEATSFEGESASRTYAIIRSRLTTTLTVRDDHSIDISIPPGGTRASGRWSRMSLIHESVTTTCADLEADGFHSLELTPADESGMIFYGLGDTIHILDLKEGTTYLLCIWWFLDAERSFDDPIVVDREMRWITTPNRLTPVVTALAVQNRSVLPFLPAGSYTVRFCETITIPSRDLPFPESTPIPGSPVLCDWAGTRFPNPAIGLFTTPTGARGEFAIMLDPSSPRGTQILRADLSTADERGPTLILSAHFLEGSDSGGDVWEIGPPLIFEPLPEDPEELPAEIQIDRNASSLEPDGQDAIRITAEFDRAVILNASLLGEPCLTGPEPSFTSPGRSATGGGFMTTWSFRFDGLCLLSQYSVVLEVEDRAGNRASFADIAPGLPEHPGARYFNGMGWTDGYHVEYKVWSTGAPPSVPRKLYVGHFEVSVAGERWDMRLPSRCLKDNLPGALPFENRRGSPDAVWGDTPTITVSFSASEPGPTGDGGGCTPSERYRYESWTANVASTLPSVADLEIGAPFEMRVPITTVPYGPAPIDVELVIVGTVTG